MALSEIDVLEVVVEVVSKEVVVLRVVVEVVRLIAMVVRFVKSTVVVVVLKEEAIETANRAESSITARNTMCSLFRMPNIEY